MPHTTYWEPRGIVWEFFGRVSLSEVAEANAEFYTDSRSDTTRYQLFVALDVEEFVGSEEEVKMLAASDKGASKSIDRMKVGMVLKPADIPLAEIYVDISYKLHSSWLFGIFETVEEARTWIETPLYGESCG